MLKHRMSDVLAEQEILQRIIVENLELGTWWPPEKGEKSKWIPDPDPEYEEDHITELVQIEKEALQKWNLADLNLDKVGVAIGLCDDCEPFIVGHLRYKPHDRFYFLAEITNGHIMVTDDHQPANIYTMLHAFNFYLIPHGEV